MSAEERAVLLAEGMTLFALVRQEHFEFSRNKNFVLDGQGNAIDRSIPWMEEESICIALALYAREMRAEYEPRIATLERELEEARGDALYWHRMYLNDGEAT